MKPPATTIPRKYRCPVCHEKTGVKIYYGLPDPDFFKDMDEDDYELGGCMSPIVDEDGAYSSGTRHCKSCGHEWFGSYKSAVETLRPGDE